MGFITIGKWLQELSSSLESKSANEAQLSTFRLLVNAKQHNISYTRVGMLRSDAMYLTPIDIAMMDQSVPDTHNEHAVVANFGALPVNDRMVYGPYEAVKVWATQRFSKIDDWAQTGQDRRL